MGEPKLNTEQAYELAQSRGFNGKPKTLTDKVNRNPNVVKEKYGLIRHKGGHNAQWIDAWDKRS